MQKEKMMMKKILMLGGSAQQIIAIETAKQMGYYTIVCDYLVDNPGQYVADKFYLESTTDKEKILEIAKKEKVDGVLAYASDPAAPTAAYVAELLGLPTNPYQSTEILCNKDKFRTFLLNNGFNVPRAEGYVSVQDIKEDVENFNFPVIVKPVDSSGSKGITVLYSSIGIEQAFEEAKKYSRCNRIIVEEFVEKAHSYLVGGDIFVVDGKIILWGLMNCHRDEEVNSLVPVGKSYPLELEETDVDKIKATLQTLVEKLHINSGAMNVEVILDTKGRVFLLDVGPRNGGNMIPDLLGYIFGVDIIEMTIDAAMGNVISFDELEDNKFYATHNIHSKEDGKLVDIIVSEELKNYIVKKYLYKESGQSVEYFDNAAKALGIIFMKFGEQEEMQSVLSNINNHIQVVVRE